MRKRRAKNPQVSLWRKRMRRFDKLKPEVLDLALKINQGDVAATKEFLTSPHPALNGATPRDRLNPTSIYRLFLQLKRQYKLSQQLTTSTD